MTRLMFAALLSALAISPAVAQTATKQNFWGAIAFTADGSYATSWKKASKGDAEGDAAVRCSKFGRGSCETTGFDGDTCVGLSTFIGSHSGRRWRLSYTAGSPTSSGAQQRAMARCNEDKRTRNRCQLRTVVCADGR
jgi:hypothetical protein